MAQLMIGLLALCAWVSVSAESLQPFTAQTMDDIEQRHDDRPFVLALWSLTCPPCLYELDMLGEWQQANPDTPLVLVSIDVDADETEVVQQLKKSGVADADNWIFADAYVEKLRFSVDPQWRGELPRSYLYSADGERHAISGKLTPETLRAWQEHLDKSPDPAPAKAVNGI